MNIASEMSPKAAAFIRKHWPAKGRAERIARAEQAWNEAIAIASTFKKLDPATAKWIAEDPDLEISLSLPRPTCRTSERLRASGARSGS